MKKKLIVAAGIVLAIVVGVLFWFMVIGVEMIPFSQDKITKVTLMSGSTGETIELSKEEWTSVIEACEPIRCKYRILPEHGGWNYRIMIEGDGAYLDIVFVSGQLVIIDGKDYRINSKQGDEAFKLLESFYKEGE